eukprot:m.633074 g.633074  ORF g.633074 m.633074 type:complete len:182 (-) comp22580_c0_seq19:435-980(-)
MNGVSPRESSTFVNGDDIKRNLPPHYILWLEAQVKFVDDISIPLETSASDEGRYNDADKNSDCVQTSPRKQRWSGIDEHNAAGIPDKRSPVTPPHDVQGEERSTATILRNRAASVVKEIKDPEFWKEFGDGAETALKGQYTFIKTTLSTVAALSPVTETFRFTVRTVGTTYSKIRELLSKE